jgi:hypothetical protein
MSRCRLHRRNWPVCNGCTDDDPKVARAARKRWRRRDPWQHPPEDQRFLRRSRPAPAVWVLSRLTPMAQAATPDHERHVGRKRPKVVIRQPAPELPQDPGQYERSMADDAALFHPTGHPRRTPRSFTLTLMPSGRARSTPEDESGSKLPHSKWVLDAVLGFRNPAWSLPERQCLWSAAACRRFGQSGWSRRGPGAVRLAPHGTLRALSR